MREFSPIKIFIFLACCLGIMAMISFVFPKDGIQVTETLTIRFPTLHSIFNNDQNLPDISSIAEIDTESDQLASDSLPRLNDTTGLVALDTSIHLLTNIQYGEGGMDALSSFFNALSQTQNTGSELRILHYGDSQIEGDRITAYLRLKLQSRFGGAGTGFVSIMPVAPSVGIESTWSEGWERYTGFTIKDKRVSHSNFGPGASFCRFMDYKTEDDSILIEETAWFTIKTNAQEGASFRGYNTLNLYYGNAEEAVYLEFYENGILIRGDSLAKGGNYHTLSYNVSPGPGTYEFKFTGFDSPDIYGVSFDGSGGVMVDNFGLRGSSGTFFTRLNLSHIKQFYDEMHIGLIILQYGGNALHGMESEEEVIWYTNSLKKQIQALRNIAPDASILIIGPADMSVKEGTTYSTHPLLETMRDKMKQMAFDSNAGFFDMYACMGGKNSMLSWVEEGIASTDHIHFSPSGSRKIAVLIHQALMSDYNTYMQTGK